MNIINHNPYRTLGVLASASEREIQKQIAIIKRFAEVGQAKTFDYDFPAFGNITRSIDAIQTATSKIEQAKNRVYYALFWFLHANRIDEVALNNLKNGHTVKAVEIWEKALKEGDVTAKNFSAVNNLSTLQLALVTCEQDFDAPTFLGAIRLKSKLLRSDVLDYFIKAVAGEDFSIATETIQKGFADEVVQLAKPYLSKTGGVKVAQLIEIFSAFSSEIKQYFTSKFTDAPQHHIENEIERTKEKRKHTPEKAEEYGTNLYTHTKKELSILKNVWGINHVQYQMLVNKAANEIMQCSIEFFKAMDDDEKEHDMVEVGEKSMKVMKMAKSVGPVGQAKTRVDENIENLQESIDNRLKMGKSQESLLFIAKKLHEYRELPDTIENAKAMVLSCKPKLQSIKVELGASNDMYLKASSAVVHNVLNSLIEIVNEQQQDLISLDLSTLRRIVESAKDIMIMLSSMDMEQQVRNRFRNNESIIKQLASSLGISYRPSSSSSAYHSNASSSSSNSTNSGSSNKSSNSSFSSNSTNSGSSNRSSNSSSSSNSNKEDKEKQEGRGAMVFLVVMLILLIVIFIVIHSR